MGTSKREIVLEAIEKGGATIESLAEIAECKYASVMSMFSMLRLMGKCPVKDVEPEEEGGEFTYRIVTAEDWEAIKAEKAANADSNRTSTKTPEERLEAAEKAITRTEKAKDAALKRANDNEDSEILDLRVQKAVLEFKIATSMLAAAQMAMPDKD